MMLKLNKMARPAGVSVSEFAKQLGVSPSTVRRIEVGIEVNHRTVFKIAEKLRADVPVGERLKCVEAASSIFSNKPLMVALIELMFVGNDAELRYQEAARIRGLEIKKLKLAA